MTKLVHAVYTDDDLVLDAVQKSREANYTVTEVFSPFPIHGLDKVMGLKPTRLAITSFMYGLGGLSFAIWMTNYMMIVDWPQNIGGKPSFSFFENLPAFIVILFEMTVFFAAHFMVITYYMRSRLWPFKKAENPDPRTTNDLIIVELKVEETAVEELSELLKKTGVKEIRLTD